MLQRNYGIKNQNLVMHIFIFKTCVKSFKSVSYPQSGSHKIQDLKKIYANSCFISVIFELKCVQNEWRGRGDQMFMLVYKGGGGHW